MKELCSKILLFAVVASAAQVFCGCSPSGNLYVQLTDKPPAAAISDPRTWLLSGTIPNAKLAVDGDRSTEAVSNLIHENTSVIIDLRKACLFNAVFVHHGSMPDGYCGRVAVFTSFDGQNYTKQFEAPGTREVTSLLIIKPVPARFVKLQALKQGPGSWSVAEVYLQ